MDMKKLLLLKAFLFCSNTECTTNVNYVVENSSVDDLVYAIVKGYSRLTIEKIYIQLPEKDINKCSKVNGNLNPLIACCIHGCYSSILDLIFGNKQLDVNKPCFLDGYYNKRYVEYKEVPIVSSVNNQNLAMLALLVDHPEIDVNKKGGYNDDISALRVACDNLCVCSAKLLFSHPSLKINSYTFQRDKYVPICSLVNKGLDSRDIVKKYWDLYGQIRAENIDKEKEEKRKNILGLFFNNSKANFREEDIKGRNALFITTSYFLFDPNLRIDMEMVELLLNAGASVYCSAEKRVLSKRKYLNGRSDGRCRLRNIYKKYEQLQKNTKLITYCYILSFTQEEKIINEIICIIKNFVY